MVKLEQYSKLYLDNSWEWLSDPEVKYLTQTPDFTRDEQLEWFEKLETLDNYKIWGISYNQRRIGVFGIKNIEDGKGEYWGYIGEKEYWGKGLGKDILRLIFINALEMNLKELYLKVIVDNVRAISLYETMGFVTQLSKEGEFVTMVKKL